MSQEISIFRTCDHYVTEDLTFINSDYRTITISRLIGNQRSFIVKRNGFDIDPDSEQFGFSLERDPTYVDQYGYGNSGPQGQRLMLKFKKRQKSNDDFYELSYYTTVGWCPKCNSLSIYFDWVFDDRGRLFMIKNEEKLIQDVIKGTLTVKGSNTYHTWYGTILDTLIGGKLANFSSSQGISSQRNLQVLLGNDVTTFLNNLKKLQLQQKSVQTVTDKELLDQIILISVQQNPQNPGLVEISIKISNVDASKFTKGVKNTNGIIEITRVIDKNNRLRVTGGLTDPLNPYNNKQNNFEIGNSPNTQKLIF